MAMKRPAEDELVKEGGEKLAKEEFDKPAEVVKVETREDFWRVQIEAVYRRRNPHKLAGVAELLKKYSGKEATLYAKVCRTYDLDPAKFYADPKAWERYDGDVQDAPATDAVASTGVGAGSFGAGTAGTTSSAAGLFGALSGASAPPTGSPFGGVVLPDLFGLGAKAAAADAAGSSLFSFAPVSALDTGGLFKFPTGSAKPPAGPDNSSDDEDPAAKKPASALKPTDDVAPAPVAPAGEDCKTQ